MQLVLYGSTVASRITQQPIGVLQNENEELEHHLTDGTKSVGRHELLNACGLCCDVSLRFSIITMKKVVEVRASNGASFQDWEAVGIVMSIWGPEQLFQIVSCSHVWAVRVGGLYLT